jgi:hypothetical protein
VLNEWITLQRSLIAFTSWSAVAVITTPGIFARFTTRVCTRHPFRKGNSVKINDNLRFKSACFRIHSFCLLRSARLF